MSLISIVLEGLKFKSCSTSSGERTSGKVFDDFGAVTSSKGDELIRLFFFRNNLKIDRMNKGDIISPSSSEVIGIKSVGGKNKISTYLSPLDRHFMVAPVDCRVKKIEKKLEKGDAERVTVYFEDMNGKSFSLSQIVKKLFHGPGLLGSWVLKLMYDNRIVCFCKEGDKLKKGERWGLIRFGSAMEYTIPKSYKINMKVGEKYSLGNIIGNMKQGLKDVDRLETWGSDLFENITLKYVMILSIAPLVVFFYGWYRCKNILNHKDVLEFSLFKNLCVNITRHDIVPKHELALEVPWTT